MPQFTKQMVWEMFGDDARNFAIFCFNALHDPTSTPDDDTKALVFMFTQFDAIDIGSSLLTGFALPTLLSKGVISQATVDRIQASISG